jgi:diadenosine tetraphosphate (Ap4A) HIT family hydrolase
MSDSTCPLCAGVGGVLVFQAEKFRVIRAIEAGFPAFYRVVWTAHVAEFSDLDLFDRALCMAAVCAVEQALREHLQPTKINLAALGNVVAHLHWHVIARFDWDAHFPATIWSEPCRSEDERALALIRRQLGAVEQAIQSSLISMGLTL